MIFYFIKNRMMPAIYFIAGIILLNSCTYTKLDNSPCNTFEMDTVSFNRDVIPLFNSYCNTSGCHSGSIPAGSLSLESSIAYSELMQPGKGYVDTLNPKFSVLYTQMISVSQPMPPTGNLDACKTEMILNWIQQGAKNN